MGPDGTGSRSYPVMKTVSASISACGMVLNRESRSRASFLMSPPDSRTIGMPAGVATSRSRRSSAA